MNDFEKDKIDTLAHHLQNLYVDDDYDFDGFAIINIEMIKNFYT